MPPDCLTRRDALVSGLALATAGCERRGRNSDGSALVLWGPPAGPSITLAFAAAEGMLNFLADKVEVGVWRSPDELRAGLVSGDMDLTIAPLNTVANLYNRGQDVRLVNVMTDGLLYVVSSDHGISRLSDLKGRSLAVPYRRDAPEIVLRRLLAHHRLSTSDVEIRTTGSPVEAAQLMVTGRVDAAFVPEPAATGAIMAARLTGRQVTRVIDIQAEWRALTGRPDGLPQAGLAVTGRYHERHRAQLPRLNAALHRAAATVRAEPARAARAAAASLGLPAMMLEKAIRFSNLTAVPAREARPAIAGYFASLAEMDSAILGGRLPDDGFYL